MRGGLKRGVVDWKTGAAGEQLVVLQLCEALRAGPPRLPGGHAAAQGGNNPFPVRKRGCLYQRCGRIAFDLAERVGRAMSRRSVYWEKG
eukprot:2575710-Rhodomonas_salina.2